MMKPVNISLCTIILLMACSAHGVPPKPDFAIPDGQGGTWEVEFEDDGLCVHEKAAIEADYAEVLSYRVPHGSCPAKGQAGQRRMNLAGKGGRSPEAAMGHIGLLRICEDGKEVAVIDQSLCDAYKKALAVREKHGAAFSALPDFVAFATEMDESELPDTFGEIVCFVAVPEYFVKALSGKPKSRIVEEFGQFSYRAGSLLDYREIDGRPMAVLRGFPRNSEKRRDGYEEIPVIYDSGSWKFLLAGWMFE